MMTLLILADDFTGALDAGVKFAQAGARVCVTADTSTLASHHNQTDILSLALPTRHLPPAAAARLVHSVLEQAKAFGIPNVYKKIDSTLRGNIGCELEAMLSYADTFEIPLIPSFPGAGRIVRNGVATVDGVPLHESAFAKDPLNPVHFSRVEDILGQTTKLPIRQTSLYAEEMSHAADAPGIVVYDAATDGELREIARLLARRGRIRVTAGSAGFARALAAELFPKPESKRAAGKAERAGTPDKTLILCGSVNQVSLLQMQYAQERGVPCVHVPFFKIADPLFVRSADAEHLLNRMAGLLEKEAAAAIQSASWEAGATRVEDMETVSRTIAKNMGALAQGVSERAGIRRLIVLGGDTLQGVMGAMGIDTLFPLRELAEGVVEAEARGRSFQGCIVAKAGGFGKNDLVMRLLQPAWTRLFSRFASGLRPV